MSDDNTPAPGEKPVYEVTIDQPGLPKGELVSIPGLGEFENGKTFEVTRDQADAFRARGAKTVLATDEDNNFVVEDGQYKVETVQGPTLLAAFKDSYVEVTTIASKNGGGN